MNDQTDHSGSVSDGERGLCPAVVLSEAKVTDQIFRILADVHGLRIADIQLLDKQLRLLLVFTFERCRTDQHFVEHYAETPVVMGYCQRFSLNEFRG